MKRVAWAAGAALLAVVAPAGAEEGGPIRGGEHDGFSRIVLRVDPRTEWSLETGPDSATIRFPATVLDFDAAQVFARMKRDRVASVRSVTEAGSTRVEVGLGCDCRISTSFVDGRYLALDVADRGAAPPLRAIAPPPESPVARATREAGAVSSAEEVLLRQIERAAKQGVVDLGVAPTEDASAPPPRAQPVAQAHPEPAPSPAAAIPQIALRDRDQISATTVFDRDKPESPDAPPAAAPECLPDDALDVARWSNGAPLFDQVPALETRLVGEFDIPDPRALGDLARLYVRFGFGVEAAGLLAGFDAPLPDRALLADLARVVDGRPVAPDGPLAVQAPCPGRHALWLALGGAAPVYRDAPSFGAVQAAFAELPPDLRGLLGPRLALRLIDAGQPQAAQQILDLTARPGSPASNEMALAEAGLTAVQGQPLDAARQLDRLTGANDPVAPDALARLARLTLDAGLPLRAGIEADLRTASIEARHGTREPVLRGLLAEILAREGALAAAIAETRAAGRELPGMEAQFDALATRLLAAADPAKVGNAAYAEVALDAAPRLDTGAAGDPARRAIAAQLLGLGLPDAALGLLGPPLARGDAAARLLAAEAQLRLGAPSLAQATLAGLSSPEATTLRARALAQDGAFGTANNLLQAAGLDAAAAPYAWPSGDWARAGAGTTDPQRAAMAGYMAARSGTGPAPAPAADPAKLDGAAAFQQPLPALDRPSLAATRRLLDTGPQVEGFVQQLIAPAPPPPTTPPATATKP